jgi:hypothetical protein
VRRSDLVAFGEKRTWTGMQNRLGRSKMTQMRHLPLAQGTALRASQSRPKIREQRSLRT